MNLAFSAYSMYLNILYLNNRIMYFTKIGQTSHDETTPYKVTGQKAQTVREFINEVLHERPKEWGYISVGKHFYQSGAIRVAEYRYGKLVSKSDGIALDIKINEIISLGGWSRMDYTINWNREARL